jgi:hypothetical protein
VAGAVALQRIGMTSEFVQALVGDVELAFEK